jgi:hypothetical protein
MSKTSRGTSFWNKPGKDIAPGDIFPGIILPTLIPPVRHLKKSGVNASAKYTQQQLWEMHPVDPDAPPPGLADPGGAEVVSRARISLAMFLNWGSDVDADLVALAKGKKPAGRVWLAAPVENLDKLQDEKKHEQPDGAKLSDRDVVRINANYNRFFLPPFPGDPPGHMGRFVDFKKVAPVGVQSFIDAKDNRLAAVSRDALNDMFHHLCWHFTRAEIFFHPITCVHCGGITPIDVRFKGQDIPDDPL